MRLCYRAIVFASLLAMFALGAAAQNCGLGVFAYPDPSNYYNPGYADAEPFVPRSVWVVVQAEAAINGASFDLEVELIDQNSYVFNNIGMFFGPNGAGLNLATPGGYNIGFQDCAFGFGGNDIVVLELVYIFYPTFGSSGIDKGPDPRPVMTIRAVPNVDENPQHPVVATCNGLLLDCPVSGEATYWLTTVPVESTSWAEVKSLY